MLKGYELELKLNTLTASEIEWYLENEEINAISNNPELKNGTIQIGDRVIRNQSNARKGIIGMLNKKRQLERQKKHQERVESGQDTGKVRIVSEGDSWFNYPTNLSEVIDHLFDECSIYSVDYGGDWLANIYAEEEYLKALRWCKPDIFLLSGGGNDLVGGYRMLEVLREYEIGARGVDLIIHDVFESILEDFRIIYRAIFQKVFHEFPNIHIICHGYDYPYFEGKDKVWFGKPFKKKGIKNLQIQNEIGYYLIDKFDEMMRSVQAEFSGVHFINNRGVVPRDMWLNELHPTAEGFRLVANRFMEKIRELTA